MNYSCRHSIERANLLHQRFVVASMMRIKREDAFAEFVELLTRHHVDDEPSLTLQMVDHLSAHSTRICKNDPAGLVCILVHQHRCNCAFPRRNVQVISGLMASL